MAVIVDFSHLYYRYIFASKDKIIENPEFSAHLLLNAIFDIKRKFKCTKEQPLIIALDNKTKKTWRHDFYDEHSKKFSAYKGMSYKGNRSKDVTMPWDRLNVVMDDLLELLRNGSDVVVLQHEKAEADDVIYTVATTREIQGLETIIVSSDRDFQQLLSDKVKIYDHMKHKYIEIENPQKLLIKDILTGQKRKDNILPCRLRLGEKTAEKLIAENLKSYLEIDDELRERYNFNKVLIDLSEVPEWICEEIEEQMEKEHFNYNFNVMLKFCQKYRLRKVAERIDELKFKAFEEKETGLFDI